MLFCQLVCVLHSTVFPTWITICIWTTMIWMVKLHGTSQTIKMWRCCRKQISDARHLILTYCRTTCTVTFLSDLMSLLFEKRESNWRGQTPRCFLSFVYLNVGKSERVSCMFLILVQLYLFVAVMSIKPRSSQITLKYKHTLKQKKRRYFDTSNK